MEQKALIDEIKKVCKQWKFDGMVLEIMSQIGKYVDKSVKFIQQFGKFFNYFQSSHSSSTINE